MWKILFAMLTVGSSCFAVVTADTGAGKYHVDRYGLPVLVKESPKLESKWTHKEEEKLVK